MAMAMRTIISINMAIASHSLVFFATYWDVEHYRKSVHTMS